MQNHGLGGIVGQLANGTGQGGLGPVVASGRFGAQPEEGKGGLGGILASPLGKSY